MLHLVHTGRRHGTERRAFQRYRAAVSTNPTIAVEADECVNASPRFCRNQAFCDFA